MPHGAGLVQVPPNLQQQRQQQQQQQGQEGQQGQQGPCSEGRTFAGGRRPARWATGFSNDEERELLWAGYSDLSEQLSQAHSHNKTLRAELESLHAAVQRLQQRQSADSDDQQRRAARAAAGPWQAVSFLLLFLLVINIAGAIASFQLAASSFTCFGWGAKQQVAKGLLVRPMMELVSSAVPAANSIVVIVFCIQAIKAAWMCLAF